MSPVCARGRVGADGRRGPNNAQREHAPRVWFAAVQGHLLTQQQRTPQHKRRSTSQWLAGQCACTHTRERATPQPHRGSRCSQHDTCERQQTEREEEEVGKHHQGPCSHAPPIAVFQD
jgi:hypothetical protein